ncbi:MAG: hypothetical protein FWK01_16380 [Pantanalinema sp. GBBB05]|nr:hypothetical protein [Pantanalinema sp. GBBB05]
MANPLPPPITTVRSAWLRSLTPGTKVRWCSNILGHFTCRKSIIKNIQEGKIHMIGNVTIPISDGVTVTKAGCIWWLEPLDSRDTYVGVSAQLLEEWLRTIRSAFDLTENERVEELLNDVITDIEKVINNAQTK